LIDTENTEWTLKCYKKYLQDCDGWKELNILGEHPESVKKYEGMKEGMEYAIFIFEAAVRKSKRSTDESTK